MSLECNSIVRANRFQVLVIAAALGPSQGTCQGPAVGPCLCCLRTKSVIWRRDPRGKTQDPANVEGGFGWSSIIVVIQLIIIIMMIIDCSHTINYHNHSSEWSVKIRTFFVGNLENNPKFNPILIYWWIPVQHRPRCHRGCWSSSTPHFWVFIHRSISLGLLTLAELHVLVLTSFIKLIKLLQNLMKLLPNHIIVW